MRNQIFQIGQVKCWRSSFKFLGHVYCSIPWVPWVWSHFLSLILPKPVILPGAHLITMDINLKLIDFARDLLWKLTLLLSNWLSLTMVVKQIQRKIWHNSPKAKKAIQFHSILTQGSKNGILYALLNRTVADKQLGLWN